MQYFKKVYDNGLTLIADTSDTTSFCEYSISFLAGSRFQDDVNSGVAHVLEHSLNCVPAYNLSEDDIVNFHRMRASYTNATTTVDHLSFWGKCFNNDLIDILDLRLEQLFNPIISNDLFLRERAIVYQEMHGLKYLREGKDRQKLVILNKQYPDILDNFNGGFHEKVAAMKLEDILAFYKKHFKVNRTVISVNGNADIEKLDKFLTKKFSSYPAAKPQKMPRISGKLDFDKECYIIDDNTGTIELSFNVPFSKSYSKEHAKKGIFALATCSDEDTPLQKKIRKEKNLTYWISAQHATSYTTNYIRFRFKTSKLKEFFEALLDRLYDITKHGVDEGSLAAAKAICKRNYLTVMEEQLRGSCKNTNTSAFYNIFISHDDRKQLYEYEENITNKDIKQVAKSLFKNNKIMITAESKTIKKEELEEFFPLYDKYCKMVQADEKKASTKSKK